MEKAAKNDAQKDHPFDQCTGGYNPATTKSPGNMSHGPRAVHEGSIDVEGSKFVERNPTRIDHLVDRSEFMASGMEPDAKVNVYVRRFVSVPWNLVRVDSHQRRAKEAKFANTSLLTCLSTGGIHDADILRFKMSSGLEPPVELAVMNKQQFASIRRQYEC